MLHNIKENQSPFKVMFNRFYLLILIIFPILFTSCSSQKKTYTIGLDPSFFPLDLMGKQTNLLAFSNELLYEISKIEGVNLKRVNMSWDNLLSGLDKKKYDSILSSMHPYIYILNKYHFSNLLLHTGPVLVSKLGSSTHLFDGMKGKEVAVSSSEDEALLIKLYPQVIIHSYHSIPIALNALLNETIDAIMMNYILALNFSQDLYAKEIKILTPPLNDMGLRLITRNGDQELIKIFNRGLKKLHDQGIYIKLLKKWSLD